MLPTRRVRGLTVSLQSKNKRVSVGLPGIPDRAEYIEDCAAECVTTVNCWGFSYQEMTGECIQSSVWTACDSTHNTFVETGALLFPGELNNIRFFESENICCCLVPKGA